MAEYIYEEFIDIHLTYTEAKKNRRKARRLCEQRFPIRCIPSHPTFSSVDDCEKLVRIPSQTAIQDICEMHKRQKWKSEF